MKKLIMTDLDCTLLPMDQDKYIERYFEEIAKFFVEKGFDGKLVVTATMKASYAMAKNNGSVTNAQAFESAFAQLLEDDADAVIELFDDIYGDRYDSIRDVAQYNDKAQLIANLMKDKASYAVVATQSMFPREAVKKRLNWTGVDINIFDYVTTYDSCHYCKPNPMYYQEIMDRYSVTAEQTLMIGNDITEDILPCKELGVDTFLVTNNIINTIDYDISSLTKGTYDELIEYLKALK